MLDWNNDSAPDLLVGAIQVPGFVPLQPRAWHNDGTDDVFIGGWGTQARLLLTDIEDYQAQLPVFEEIKPDSR